MTGRWSIIGKYFEFGIADLFSAGLTFFSLENTQALLVNQRFQPLLVLQSPDGFNRAVVDVLDVRQTDSA